MPFRKPLLGELLDYSDPLTKGLIYLGLFNEGSGNKVFDLSGNGGNVGTLQGDTHWVPGKFGSVLDFDGVDDFVNIPHSSSLSFGLNDFTISIWFNSVLVPADAQPAMLGKGDTGAGEWMCRLQSKENVGMFLNGGDIDLFTAGTDYSDGLWHHAVFVRQGDNLYIYVDGVLAASGGGVGASDLNDTTSLRFGSADGDNSRFWDGLLDIPMIWNDRALSASEIALLYREPFRLIGKRRREGAVAGGVSVGFGFINAAGQADIVTSSLAGTRWSMGAQADIVTLSLAGMRRLNRPGAGQADIVTSSFAGFRRLNRPGAAQADIVTSSLSGMTKTWNAAAQASILTSSLAGMRRLNRPGAAQASITIQTFAGATGGAAAITLEEIFRYRRFRDAGVFRRRNLKGVY